MKKYHELPVLVWDGQSPLYSYSRDRFYNDLSEVESELEKGWDMDSLKLMPTRPVYVRPLGWWYCEGDLPEDGSQEPPLEVKLAMDAFNKAVHGIILSWEPIPRRLQFQSPPG